MKNYFRNLDKRTTYVLLVSAFVILSLVMNVTAVISVPIINGVENLNIIRLDGSVLQSIEMTWALPLAAIMMVVADLLSESFSKRQTIQAIAIGYIGGLFLAIWLLIGQGIAGDYASNNFGLVVDGQIVAHFYPWDALAQSWRFLVAGFIAYVLSNAANTGLMWFLKAKDGDSKIWKRVVISSLVGQAVDDFVFLYLGFMPLNISFLEKSYQEIWWQFITTYAIELGIEVAVSPITVFFAKKINKMRF